MKIVRHSSGYRVFHNKNVKNRKINSATGTRFKKFTVQQYAFETLIKCIETGQTYYPDLCKRFNNITVENGSNVNLDTSYLNLAISSHPDFFKIDLDKKVSIKKYPKTDSSEEQRKIRGQKVKDELKAENVKARIDREETKAIGTFDTLDKKRKIKNEKGMKTKCK